jgi:hypothetical protein
MLMPLRKLNRLDRLRRDLQIFPERSTGADKVIVEAAPVAARKSGSRLGNGSKHSSVKSTSFPVARITEP